MHLYVASRGIWHETLNWVNDLSAQYLPYEFNGTTHVQLAMRPIMLWEIVFPKEHLGTVCRTLWTDNLTGKMKQPHDDNWKIGLGTSAFRKILGASPIPEIGKGDRFLIRNANIACLPIGIKDDGTKPTGEEQL